MMAPRQRWLAVRRRERGFALIIVLWAFVLIALVVIHLTAAGRTELRIASNVAANAAAQAAADGAIYRAIFNLLDPRPDERWMLDGSTHEVQVGTSTVTLRIENEAARINPNLASSELLKALLNAVSGNPEQAERVASAIAEWIGVRKGSQPLSGINVEYQAAGLHYGPPGEPLESIDELGRVPGVTPGLFEALRPHLTLFGPAIPDAATADPVVARAIAEAARKFAEASPSLPISDNSGPLTARITATAQGPGNATASRIAIARVGPGVPSGYSILSWLSNPD
jgi:general secretion pathway protein K